MINDGRLQRMTVQNVLVELLAVFVIFIMALREKVNSKPNDIMGLEMTRLFAHLTFICTNVFWVFVFLPTFI